MCGDGLLVPPMPAGAPRVLTEQPLAPQLEGSAVNRGQQQLLQHLRACRINISVRAIT
jgi:hypothetical protein